MRRTPLFALLLSLAGCTEPKPTVRLADALPTLLIPPSSTVISKEAGEEALKIRFRSDLEPAAVAQYYRVMLAKAPWKLVSDSPDGTGGTTLLAQRPDGPPLWVTIRKAEGASGSFVDLAGAKTH